VAVLFGGHAAQNERQALGYRIFRSGVQGPNVAPPASIQRVLVTQETPDHPRPRSTFYAGVQGPDVRVPVSDRILIRQQFPLDHPGALLRPGVQGPNVGQITAIAQRLIQGQEQPFHPRSLFVIGPPPVRAQLPFIAPLIVGQHMPGHPRSTFHSGTPPVSYEDVQVFVIH
jgi:hypothetical protein